MTIYNRPLVYIGFIIAVAGGLINYYFFQDKEQILTVIFQIIGIVLMLLAFKKPKHLEDNPEI